MSLSAIRTRVANNINRTDIPDVAGGLIDQWINDAQRRICRSYNFVFMESEVNTTLVVAQQAYSIPDGSGTDLRYKTDISLELIDSDNSRIGLKRIFKQDAEYRQEFKDTTETGTPRNYAIQKGQIYLFPKPDKAITMNLEYYGFLDDLSADTDTNDLISLHPEAVEVIATSLGFRYVFEEERANYWENKGINLISEMVKEDCEKQYGSIEDGMSPEDGAGTSPVTNRYSKLSEYY